MDYTKTSQLQAEEIEDSVAEEELVGDLNDARTSRLLRTLGEGYDDNELFRLDLQQAIDTSVSDVFFAKYRKFYFHPKSTKLRRNVGLG